MVPITFVAVHDAGVTTLTQVPPAFAITQAAVHAARQAFRSLPSGSSDEQYRPFHERLADAEDTAVRYLIAKPARSEDELYFKLDALIDVIQNGRWSDWREAHLAAAIAEDARVLGLLAEPI